MADDRAARKAAKSRRKSQRRKGDERAPRVRKRGPRRVTRAPCYHPPVLTEEDLEWNEDEGGPSSSGEPLGKRKLSTAVLLLDPAAVQQHNKAQKIAHKQQKKQLHVKQKIESGASSNRDEPAEKTLALAKYGPSIAKCMAKAGFAEATEIQASVWRHCLGGRDVIGIAPTGSGKTFAYLLTCISRIKELDDSAPDVGMPRAQSAPRALILTPTRELAAQIVKEARSVQSVSHVACAQITGGTDKQQQVSAALKPGVGIVVGTVGRLSEVVTSGELSLDAILILVLDEFDKLLNASNIAYVIELAKHIPGLVHRMHSMYTPKTTVHQTVVDAGKSARYALGNLKVSKSSKVGMVSKGSSSKKRLQEGEVGVEGSGRLAPGEGGSTTQVMLFSATFSEDTLVTAKKWTKKAKYVHVEMSEKSISKTVTQVVQVCAQHKKDAKLLKHLEKIKQSAAGQRNLPRILIFANQIQTVRHLHTLITEQNYRATLLHGDRSQPERTAALTAFQSGKSNIMVATDVAARGLHIRGLPYVILYDFPSNLSDYIHRVGRTGRLSLHGHAFGFFTRNLARIAGPMVALLEHHGQVIDPNLVKLKESYDVIEMMSSVQGALSEERGSAGDALDEGQRQGRAKKIKKQKGNGNDGERGLVVGKKGGGKARRKVVKRGVAEEGEDCGDGNAGGDGGEEGDPESDPILAALHALTRKSTGQTKERNGDSHIKSAKKRKQSSKRKGGKT